MTKVKIAPNAQKAKLLDQLKEIKTKLAEFDGQRAAKVGSLAKQFRLIDLSDDILEKEFKAIRDKYKDELSAQSSALDDSKKNS
jgi:hypothetical protein